MIGITKQELEEYFPNLKPFENGDLHLVERSAKQLGIQEAGWIGDTSWLVKFEEGRVGSISIIKGN